MPGQLTIKPQFKTAGFFSEGLAAVQSENGLWRVINDRGDFVILPKYNELSDCMNGVFLS